jgi:bacillithiol disulfide reductase
VIVIGAGPSGLSAAIAAKRRGLDYQILEQGVLVNSIYRFPPHMVFFTTPELLEIGGLPFVSPYEKPTRPEALRYYRKVVETFDLQIAYDETVTSVELEKAGAVGKAEGALRLRSGQAGEAREDELDEDQIFAIETQTSRGVRRARHARTVVFATGYYDHPVMLNIPGEDLPHVNHFYTDPHPYFRKRVVVVGGGNSAAEAALELYRAGASVTLVHRGPEMKSTIKYWVRPDIENRFKEGSVASRFNSLVEEIRPTSVLIATSGPAQTSEAEGVRSGSRDRDSEAAAAAQRWGPASIKHEELPADAVFLLVGYRADTDLFVRAGIQLTEREGPVHDPETFETNVPGLYVAGGAIAGVDTGTIFIENGRFHGEKIIEAIARRLEHVHTI